MRTIKLLISVLFCMAVLLSCTPGKKMIKISEAEYLDKVYGSWLGQIIGNIYGLPHENAYIDEPGPENFPYGYGNNLQYLKAVNGAFSDDDTDFEYIYLLAMEKYGPEPTYAQLTESWKYHVRERVWLANRAALAAMRYGYTPPVTGMKAYNPHWFQIDPQLVNEIWAVTSPGMIQYAADKSGWAARITDDDWGIEPTIHYGAMYAAAFFESDIHKLIDIGNKALPKGSRFARTVEDMKRLYNKYPADWKQARKEMAQKYYHEESEVTKTIWNANLNGACSILALLYGEGDFQYTLDLACAMGFDADNQAATMSGLLGIILGSKGLPGDLLNPIEGWDKPFNDFYKNVTRYDMPDASLKDMAERMVKQAEKIILFHGGKKINENEESYYLINTRAEFIAPFEFPVAPMPAIEVGKPVEYTFLVSGGNPPYQWSILEGAFPAGITFKNGKISGKTEAAGIYPVTLQVEQNDKKVSRGFDLVVRSTNLAQNAKKILTNVNQTDVEKRDSMWLTVGRSLYADQVDVIRDGKRLGDGSTFYSISEDPKLKVHYFGYEWDTPQAIGLVDLHTGSVEENGGWFTSLNVEYRDEKGKWKSVKNLSITPPLMPGKERFNKPHFVEYLLTFQPVETRAIRVIGDAGAVKHWTRIFTHFVSLAELSVHEPLPKTK